MRRALTWLACCAVAIAVVDAARAQPKLQRYNTKFYVIFSDLDEAVVREAEVRLTRMAEVYHGRTRGFSGTIRERLPFYLFARHEDYLAAVGPRYAKTAGVFTGDKLLASTGGPAKGEAWRIVQHEGFHQFAQATIGGDLPIWVNEGLAEYFGEAIFTGDGYVTGVIATHRLARIKAWFERDNLRPLRNMMELTQEAWNTELTLVNYDQAWSMIHFLAHADGGKYQAAFNGFVSSISRGTPWEQAWEANFGRGVRAFEDRWIAYWRDMPPNSTADLYARATVATLTSFLARAASQGQRFRDVDEFFDAARGGALKAPAKDALPPSLLSDALQVAPRVGEWTLATRAGRPALRCATPSGALTGSFELRGGRVSDVDVIRE